jgi:hypothetical protein
MVVDLGELYSRNRRGSPVAISGRWSRRCAGCSGTLTHPGWRGGPVASRTQRCAILAAHERAVWPAVEECLSERPTYGLFSFFSAQSFVRLRRSPLKKRWSGPSRLRPLWPRSRPPSRTGPGGAYGRPHPHEVADSIDVDAWAGSKETDLRRKAAQNAHRQTQAGVAKFRL